MSPQEREKPKEIGLSESSRSANYIARLAEFSPSAFDISKPFTTSAEKLTVNTQTYDVLDRISAADSREYWKSKERGGAQDHDSQMRAFTDSWVQVIKTEYNRDQMQIDSMGEAERRIHEESLVVLDRLGLNAANLDASNIQQFYDKYFRNGRNSSQFVTDMQKLFTQAQIKQNIDTIRFVAEMFDAETAQDIAGILLLEAENDKSLFVERANKQANVSNKNEQTRLRRLARYASTGEEVDRGSGRTEDGKIEDPKIRILAGSQPEEEAVEGINIGHSQSDEPMDTAEAIKDIEHQIAIRRAVQPASVGTGKTETGDVERGNRMDLTQDRAEDSVDIHGAFRDQDGMKNQSGPKIGWSVPLNIPGLKFGEALPLHEEPLPENARLVGEDGDQLKIVVPESVLHRANEDMMTRSWASGRFIEQAGFFIGRVNSSPDGNLWSEVLEYVPARGAIDQSGGHFTINADVWSNLRDELDKVRTLKRDQNLIVVGWAHTHPDNWEGRMSTADETVNESFDIPGQFAYVFGAGQGRNIPLEIRDNELTDNHSFFSKGGSGSEFGSYKKHTGIRLIPDVVKI